MRHSQAGGSHLGIRTGHWGGQQGLRSGLKLCSRHTSHSVALWQQPAHRAQGRSSQCSGLSSQASKGSRKSALLEDRDCAGQVRCTVEISANEQRQGCILHENGFDSFCRWVYSIVLHGSLSALSPGPWYRRRCGVRILPGPGPLPYLQASPHSASCICVPLCRVAVAGISTFQSQN